MKPYKPIPLELETQIRKDYERITQFLNIKPAPQLIIKPGSKKSTWHIFGHYITLGIKDGYQRSDLVHECLHAKGRSHRPGFRSHRNKDRISPWLVGAIFKDKKAEDRTMDLNSIHRAKQVLRAHKNRRRRNSPEWRETNGIA